MRDRPWMSYWCVNNMCLMGLHVHIACYHEHVTGDWVGQVRNRGVGIVATSGLVWGLTSGAAAWFVTRSPFKMDTNTHIFTCSYTALICIKCAFFCLGLFLMVWGLTFSLKSSCYSDILDKLGGTSFPVSKNDINAVKKEKSIMKCFPQVCCGRIQPHQQDWDELEQNTLIL